MLKTLLIFVVAFNSFAYSQDSDWHMIIGGWNDDSMDGLTSVELFNWKTGEQCEMPLGLDNKLSAHVGAVISGTPIICGGFSDLQPQEDCYEYSSGSWSRTSSLIEATYFGGTAYVPNEGWFIFGGNSLTRSQRLQNLNSAWVEGPELFQAENEIGQCVVQLDDATTVFLGGSNNPFGIVSYDWKTDTYTENTAALTGQRSQSACALARNVNGDPLVAVAGGRNDGSKGLEVFNPRDGTVTVLSEVLPQEEMTDNQLQNAHMMSINGGTELLIYGGYDGFTTVDDIWKFTLADNKWTKVGQMIVPRDDHFVLEVTGFSC